VARTGIIIYRPKKSKSKSKYIKLVRSKKAIHQNHAFICPSFSFHIGDCIFQRSRWKFRGVVSSTSKRHNDRRALKQCPNSDPSYANYNLTAKACAVRKDQLNFDGHLHFAEYTCISDGNDCYQVTDSRPIEKKCPNSDPAYNMVAETCESLKKMLNEQVGP